ncbi:hypothetical protein CBR_g697 [Chara braunii]|uniref:Myb/SANT-like DNA-binding domain-containing protein n=1 Tax=Chara braunii TaxID=69332 RepID=A0A388KBY4_CHABU|nr:hypothetical protein CBR_g697 [Chara braunii]|eukprot:GBG67568.1 hypothetical protein CBR_g697 [Chara braunii]
MADVRRRLPLLVLAVVVFLIVVFLYVCFSWRSWKQQRKRRASTRRAAGERLMAGMQARPASAAGQGGVRSSAAEPRRRYDPSMYTHLESWDTPLPPSDEEPEKEELSTLPLASGSTQLWSQTVRADGSALDGGGEFTSLLHQGLRDDDGGGVDLRRRDEGRRGSDDNDVPIRPLGKTAGRGKGRGRGGVRGRSVGRGGRGGISDDAGKSPTYWSAEDQILLVRCKQEQDMHLVGLSHNYGRMKTKEWNWEDMSKRMANAGRPTDADDCMKKWDNLFQNYKKIQRFQNASRRPDFFRLTNEERKEHNFKFRMDRALYNEIHAGIVGNHMIFPPNVADTGSPDGVPLPRRGAGGGESVCSEAAGEGCPDERSSARESDSNVGSGAGGGKRKNARQQAFESISDVMERHGALMSSTIESSSKRQCSISTRQCDILEQEVAIQKAHYAASDETQRMICQALFEIAAAIRGRSAM